MVEAVVAPHTWLGLLGGQGTAKNLAASKYTPLPNFTKIYPAVWISIRNKYIYFVLYILVEDLGRIHNTLISSKLMSESNKLECLSLTILSNLM
jgi:hypothetical protein